MLAAIRSMSAANRGALLLVVGISIFGFSDNLTLFVSDQVGVGQFHFTRSLFAIVMVMLMGRIFGLRLVPQRWLPVLARTGFMVTAILLYFAVMPMMPIAEAGAGLFTSPIFVLIYSIVLFREKVGWRRGLAVCIGSAGVLLVLRPTGEGFSVYHLLPVVSGASYAMGSVITYRYLADESPLAILMSFFVTIGLAGGLVASSFSLFPVPADLFSDAPFLYRGWNQVDQMFLVWMALIALGASLALSLMTRAYQLTLTSYAAIYEYAYLLSVGFFGWLFWNVVPDLISFIGIGLIVIAGITIVLAQQQAADLRTDIAER